MKDFCLNCIHLADYFNAQHKFDQSLYLLQCALALLPVDQTKRKKLRATVQISLGALYLELLTASNDCESLPNINFKVCTFPLPQVEWPALKQVCSNPDAVHTFRLANTQLQRAHKVFVIDGWVTEHIKICQLQSKLYR